MTVCSFAVGTTAALRWVSKPYIWRIYQLQKPASSLVNTGSSAAAIASQSTKRTTIPYNSPLQIQTYDLLGRIKTTELKGGLDEVIPAPDRVFMNLGIKGSESFYVHEEPDCYATDDFYHEILKRAHIVPGAKSKGK